MPDPALKKELNPEQYRVMREKGAEYPYSGRLWDHEEDGIYMCAACGAELFSSGAKFDSGTGFPSFEKPLDAKNLVLAPSAGGGALQEMSCKTCGSHLGFVASHPTKKATCTTGQIRHL